MISSATKPKARELVSIIIPMLNEREGLRALKDKAADWEMVVVDDGSTDGTRDAAREELKRFSGGNWLF